MPGGAAAGALLAEAERAYDPLHPEALLPLLARAHAALVKLPDAPIVSTRRAELDEVMRSCAGLWLEALAARPSTTAGGRVRVVTSALNRSAAPLALASVSVRLADAPPASEHALTRALPANAPVADTFDVAIPAGTPTTQPDWLRRPAGRGRFDVADPLLVGQPENGPALVARFEVRVDGETFSFERGVAYRWVDPVLGERWRSLEIAPPATLQTDLAFYAFPDLAARPVVVTVTAQRAGVTGRVRLAAPAGWTVAPADGVPVTPRRPRRAWCAPTSVTRALRSAT